MNSTQVESILEPVAQLAPARREPAGVRRRRRGTLVWRALVTADLLALSIAFVIAELAFGRGSGGGIGDGAEYLVFFATLPGWIIAAKLYELYDLDEERTDHTTVDDLRRVFHLVTVGSWLFFVGSWLTGLTDPVLTKLVAFWLLAIVLDATARAAARHLCRRSGAFIQHTVILGAGDVGQLVARKYHQHPEYGINVLGFVDSDPRALRSDIGDVPVLGPLEALPELVRQLEVDRVVVAFSNDSPQQTAKLLRELNDSDVQVDIVPRLYEVVGPNVDFHDVEGLPLVGLPAAKLFPYSRRIKRAVDIVGAAIALVLTAPVWALAAWQIRRDGHGPILFRQTRLGEDMRPFTLLKFRTMRVGTDSSVHREFILNTMSSTATVNGNGLYKLERDDAITTAGRWLRRTSLDELPQLLNVLRGEMSLVGPRPCLAYEAEGFEPHHFERFSVPAGITGLWQVRARAHSTFGEALELDVAYARNWSLSLDLWLLLRTPFQLLIQRRGTR